MAVTFIEILVNFALPAILKQHVPHVKKPFILQSHFKKFMKNTIYYGKKKKKLGQMDFLNATFSMHFLNSNSIINFPM